MYFSCKVATLPGIVVEPGDSNDRRPWTIEQRRRYEGGEEGEEGEE